MKFRSTCLYPWFLVIQLSLSLPALAGPCGKTGPIVFGGLDWDSARFHNAVAALLLEKAWGCRTDEIPGSTLPMLAGLARGDVHILMEVWKDNVTEVWGKAVRRGQVEDAGVNFPDAVQGWYVPRYLVEGKDAAAPGLRSVGDLPRYKQLFRDPEEPGKGRFYNCIAGWSCEVINTKKLGAYGLLDSYTNFRPGTGAALAAAISSAVKRRQPVLAYYWGPTWLLGKYDLVMLQEPAWDAKIWQQLGEEKRPKKATAYPMVAVYKGVNKKFAAGAPQVARGANTEAAGAPQLAANVRARPMACFRAHWNAWETRQRLCHLSETG